jgi:hypothetical protein
MCRIIGLFVARSADDEYPYRLPEGLDLRFSRLYGNSQPLAAKFRSAFVRLLWFGLWFGMAKRLKLRVILNWIL